jgi:hypothetical protein
MHRIIFTSIAGADFFFWLLISPLCWILRDGLGPNTRESHGWTAIARFLLAFY